MGKTSRIGAVVVGLVLPAASLLAGDTPLARLRMRLSWFDVSGSATAIESAASHELSTLFAPASIDIDWTHASTGVQAPESDVQVIVLEQAPGVPRGVMGAAFHSDMRPHSVWVYLRHVRNTLGLGSRSEGMLRPTEQALLGRAVGRVVAHEIVHAYAPDRAHEATGLMRARLDGRFLKQKHVQLEKEAVDLVVGGLTGNGHGSILAAPQE
jgi:hypothetical protein